MGILKKVLLFLLFIAIIIGIGSFFLPNKVHVERSLTINAPVNNVYTQVNNFKNWEKWSPWKKADPGMKLTYSSDNPAGKGASYSWVGTNSSTGEGSMKILDAIPNKEIKTQLDFKGMGTSYGKWNFEPTGNSTKVTWGFDTEFSGIWKWMGLMMDGQLGGQFEDGLAEIKKIAESMPAVPAPVAEPIAAPASAN